MTPAEIREVIRYPLFFEKNRVFRVYTGGKLFSDFYGDDSEDGFYPEEWVASTVKAINRVSAGEKEGVSRIRGTDLYLDDLVRDYTKEMLGDRKTFGVLTKTLDSAIRLPIQAHPDKTFSRQYFNSNYGKAESWLVLATRENACLYFGFSKDIDKETFARLVEESKTNKKAMEPYLNRLEVKPGDVYFVPARMVHAVGEGCLILEVQEPTDFTIQPEYYCGDYLLNHQEMYLSLEKDVALDVFDYSLVGEKAVAAGRRFPKVIEETDGMRLESLISYEDTPCFAVERLILNKANAALTKKPAVYVVTEGEGELKSGDKAQPVKKGGFFFLPYAAEDTVISTEKSITVVACLPPIES